MTVDEPEVDNVDDELTVAVRDGDKDADAVLLPVNDCVNDDVSVDDALPLPLCVAEEDTVAVVLLVTVPVDVVAAVMVLLTEPVLELNSEVETELVVPDVVVLVADTVADPGVVTVEVGDGLTEPV